MIEVIDMQQNKIICSFTIPGRLESMNQYINKCRTNHFLANSFKIAEQSIVFLAVKNMEPIPEDSYPLILEYKFYEASKKRDLDNVESWAKKCVQDCLVKNGYLRNDGWGEIAGSKSEFYIDKLNPRIEVSIYSANQ
jgi:Holliday junction resolvase RusA-like endonuclease